MFFKKKFLSQKQGITLVALIVTIIVLLILAGVSLSLVGGSEGILSKASGAVDETTKASAKEKIELKLSKIVMDSYAKNGTKPDLQYIADKFRNDDEIDTVKIEDETSILAKLKEYDYEFEIDEDIVVNVKTVAQNGVSQKEYNKLQKEYDLFKTNVIQALNNKNSNLGEEESNENIIQAINQLNVGSIQLLAENYSGRYDQTISVSDIEGYENLTADNFFIVLKGTSYQDVTDPTEKSVITKDYNPLTGQLSISQCKYWFASGRALTVWSNYDVYLIKWI